jgi:hypothetical protein
MVVVHPAKVVHHTDASRPKAANPDTVANQLKADPHMVANQPKADPHTVANQPKVDPHTDASQPRADHHTVAAHQVKAALHEAGHHLPLRVEAPPVMALDLTAAHQANPTPVVATKSLAPSLVAAVARHVNRQAQVVAAAVASNQALVAQARSHPTAKRAAALTS